MRQTNEPDFNLTGASSDGGSKISGFDTTTECRTNWTGTFSFGKQ